jgi:hypothetical protein
MKKLIISLLFVVLAGCAGMNDALTPKPKLIKDTFDGHYQVQQQPTSAGDSMSEGWHLMGLFWSSKAPEQAAITAGVSQEIKNIAVISFNIDGEITDFNNFTTAFTGFESDYVQNPGGGGGVTYKKSLRTVSVPLDYVKKLALGNEIKLKVTFLDNTYSVSSFGKNHPMAAVTQKLPQFLAKVDEGKKAAGL